MTEPLTLTTDRIAYLPLLLPIWRAWGSSPC